MMGGKFSYYSIITNIDVFNQSFFGKDYDKDVVIPRKDRVYKNCPFKEYVG